MCHLSFVTKNFCYTLPIYGGYENMCRHTYICCVDRESKYLVVFDVKNISLIGEVLATWTSA
jgi:hypothetical protein